MSARKFDLFHPKKYVNVRVFNEKGNINVQLHDTIVLSYNTLTGQVKLNNGGWQTLTTKTAINTALKQIFPFAVSVFQRKGAWYVRANGQTYEFKNFMTLNKVPNSLFIDLNYPIEELDNVA